MLATSSYSSSSPHSFLPLIPSPLSPRRTNGRHQPRSFSSFMSSHPQNPEEVSCSSSGAPPSMPFSKRPIKAIPSIAQRSDALRERRRDMFLKKVKQDRDDSRWESRVEDMARLDYNTEKRRWEAEQARSAPPTYTELPEDYEDPKRQAIYSQQWHPQYEHYGFNPLSESEAEAVLQQENAELEALVSMMENQELRFAQHEDDGGMVPPPTPRLGDRHDGSSVFGSDDEEYDSIFMDLIDEHGGCRGQAQQPEEGEEMDMS